MFPAISPIVSGALISAGQMNYGIPGEYEFICPNYNTIKVTVNGGGAGGASFIYQDTISGAQVWPASSTVFGQGPFDTNILGRASLFNNELVGSGGSFGTHGTYQYPGSSGSGDRSVGGAGPHGGATGGDINTPGGGAAGGKGGFDTTGMLGGLGGSGGKVIRTYLSHELISGEKYKVIVGNGGIAEGVVVNTTGLTHPQGYVGQDGSVLIEWE